jgi:hypothetical protein
MPLVFVHGVNNRPGDSWENGKKTRHSLFRRFMYPRIGVDPDQVSFFDPMWGPDGATFVWDQAALPNPSDGVEALGSEDLATLGVVAATGAEVNIDDPNPVLAIAKQSLEAAVDTLWASSADEAAAGNTDAWAELGRQAIDYAQANKNPAWLAMVATDTAFIRELQAQIDIGGTAVPKAAGGAPSRAGSVAAAGTRTEALGAVEAWDKILEGADRVKNALGGVGTFLFFKVAREGIQRDLGLGMGDILVYMSERGTRAAPGPIVRDVMDAIRAALAAKTVQDDKLILVGHSLGGIILYEILSYYWPDLEVDVFASVGSQIGVLEEIKVFKASDPAIGPKTKVPMLPKVKRWINVYDYNDPGSFATTEIFEGTKDFAYTTGLTPRAAHSGYWIRPSFYERLAARIAEQ